jgi:hypothetical protein
MAAPRELTNKSTQLSGITRMNPVADADRAQPHSTNGASRRWGRYSRYNAITTCQPTVP